MLAISQFGRRCCRWFAERSCHFAANSRGNIVPIFALLIVPLIGFTGAAIDYSIANRTRTKIIAAMDSAVLMAVSKSSMASTATAAQTAALTFFNAEIAAEGVTTNSASITVTDTATGRTAVGTASSAVPTNFMKVMGYSTLNVNGGSTAATALPTYIDFYLLLDNTPSMGIGATPADVTTMVNNTPDQCGFACHDLNDNNNYYKLAKSLGVTTRIDVVRSATQQLMDTATATAVVSNQFRMAIYTFGSSASSAGLTTITPLTSSLTTAKSNAANIDLMTVNGQGQFDDTDTNYDSVLPALNSAMPSPGNGSTAAQPQKFVFFVSDGVADEFNAGGCSQPTLNGDGRCQEPINVALCTTMKNRGIKIAVLYTTYLALTTNWWYNNTIAPFNAGPYGPSPNSQIAQNMQSCASPGLYFEVSPTQGISDAMTALFQKAVAQARLTH